MTYLLVATSMLVSQNLFARAYGGTGSDVAYSITATPDGGFAVVGGSASFGAICEVLVLKLDPTGALQWRRTFRGPFYNVWDGGVGFSIITTPDGGIVVGGEVCKTGGGWPDYLVLKLSSSGDLQWSNTFYVWDDNYVYSIINTPDGGFAVTGYTFSYITGTPADFAVVKLNSSGTPEWARGFGGAGEDASVSITATSDGGYAVAGYTNSFGDGAYDFLVLKLTSGGSITWARTFGRMDNDLAYFIIQTTDGGYVVAGYTDSYGAGSNDFLVLKLTSTGSLEWARTFGGTGSDIANSITQATDGGYAVAGYTTSFGAGSDDFLVLKLGSDGNYPGCVQSCSPGVGTSGLNRYLLSATRAFSPTTSGVGMTSTTPNPTTLNACTPMDLSETDLSGSRPGITCSPFPGGVLFMSPEATLIKIYSADGRVAYSGNLEKGENRISLETGVYLWKVGSYKGKAVVR